MTQLTLPYYERDAYVQRKKAFYPTKIPVHHNQLRHLICSSSRDLVYVAESNVIYLVDTVARRKSQIASVTFSVRCTALGHGWFCAGGEGGHLAMIQVPEDAVETRRQRDEAFLDASAAAADDDGGRAVVAPGHLARFRFVPHEEKIGSDIVNSISIHPVQVGVGDDGRPRVEPVAVITQNDHHVRIYHLAGRREIWRSARFEQPMNHATISPDGELLLIVGDMDVGYLYRRRQSPADRWCRFEPLREFPLHKPRGARVSTYFTTSWSDGGRLCATASEYGFLMVFDVGKLLDEDADDAVVVVAPSTRPMRSPGAIRAMCFAPGPWDLLIWTENYGRVCVGNLRDNLATRQVVRLDPDGDGVEHVDLELYRSSVDDVAAASFDRNMEYLRRRRQDPIDDPEILRLTAGLAGADADGDGDRRRLYRAAAAAASAASASEDGGLAEEERQILDNIRTTRARELEQRSGAAAGATGAPHPRSILYGSTDVPGALSPHHGGVPRQPWLHEERNGLAMSSPSSRRRMSNMRHSTVHPDSDHANTDPWHTIERAMHRTTRVSRASEHGDGGDGVDGGAVMDEDDGGTTQPVSPSAVARAMNMAGRGAGPGAAVPPSAREALSMLEAQRARNRSLNQHGSRALLSPTDESLTTRGEVVRARQQRAADGEPSPRGGATPAGLRNPQRRVGLPASADISRQLHMQRDIDRSYMGDRPPAGSDASRYRQVSHYTIALDMVQDDEPTATWGNGTTGVCCSGDGRTIYVGTEAGIFDLKMDFQDRKFWPAVDPR